MSGAPTSGPISVWMPPKQHHDEPVDGAADRDGFGRDRALGEGEQAARHAADRAGNREGDPVHPLDVDADRFGPQR